MAVEMHVPALGESVLEATVGRWLKSEGDAVGVGDPLVELETEKVAVEVTSEAAGVLEKILRREGETVRVGDVLARLAEGAPAAAAAESRREAAVPAGAATARAVAAGAATSYGGPEAPIAPPKASPTERPPVQPSAGDHAPSAPSARRLADERGINLAQVAGSGPDGRITRQDVVEQAPVIGSRSTGDGAPSAVAEPARLPPAAPPAPPTPTPSSRSEERVRMSRRRLTIARRLVEAQHTAAMLTTFNEADMSAVMALRQQSRAIPSREARRRPRLHVVLHQGRRRRAEELSRP